MINMEIELTEYCKQCTKFFHASPLDATAGWSPSLVRPTWPRICEMSFKQKWMN